MGLGMDSGVERSLRWFLLLIYENGRVEGPAKVLMGTGVPLSR